MAQPLASGESSPVGYRLSAIGPSLEVEDLHTSFFTDDGVVQAVNGISLSLTKGEVLGIVGESGSGKSVASLSLMRLIPWPPGKITNGSIRFNGRDLLGLSEEEMRRVRGNDISMIFQEPLTALNPVFTVGDQIMEPLVLHQGLSKRAARERAVEMLQSVGVSNPSTRADAYPHQLSGGLRQRAMIAMALACEPELLIADEPTTALDVSIQAQILELMRTLQRTLHTSMIFITHDLGVVAEMADRVAVMYAGRIVEEGTTRRLFATPKHPYTWGLFDCLPNIEEPKGVRLVPIAGRPPNLRRPPAGCTFHPRCPYAFDRCRIEEPPLLPLPDGQTVRCWLYGGATEETRREPPRIEATRHHQVVEDATSATNGGTPLLAVDSLKKHFPITAGIFRRQVASVHAVDGVTFSIARGETLGLVGESGCGKTTTGRLVLRLLDPTAGSIRFDGQDVVGLSARQLRPLRGRMQIIFQDPFSSLNPRRMVGDIIAQPLKIHGVVEGKRLRERVHEILDLVGINPRHANSYPHEYSGGQRQRIGIARAIASNPDFIVADEPVSALDVSIQAQIINLMQDLRTKLDLSYLFISHNLSVVRSFCDRVAVMYLGEIVELAENRQLYETPLHPYTKALLSAVPKTDPTRAGGRIVLAGDVPSPIHPPAGCRFHTRCPYAFAPCAAVPPILADAGGGHLVACHLYPSSAPPAADGRA